MDAAQLKQMVEASIADAQVFVEGGGDRFNITVIAEQFAGLSPVKRQQAVYAGINHLIIDGTIHAVNLQTYTPEQWQAAN